MKELLTILEGDAVERLRSLETGSVQCCVTSPPYWGLRDYGTAAWEEPQTIPTSMEAMVSWRDCDHKSSIQTRGNIPGTKQATNNHGESGSTWNICGKCGARRIDSQLGLERTPEEYMAKMVEVFREVRRVLRKDGTLWLNLGDSYWGAKGGKWDKDDYRPAREHEWLKKPAPEQHKTLKTKDLCGIPWRVAFALQADGWWLRSDIIWAKPNPMPESVTDRPTKSHEYLFLLTKSANYFYDAEAIKEKGLESSSDRYNYEFSGTRNGAHPPNDNRYAPKGIREFSGSRNKRSVWTIATQPYPEAHFATFPEEIPKLCILAGTSAKGCCARCGAPWERIVEVEGRRGYDWNANNREGGNRLSVGQSASDAAPRISTKTLGWQATCKCESRIELESEDSEWITAPLVPCTVLDPFAGSGTTGAVALELGRKAVLIELNPAYVQMIHDRCNITPGLALA